MIRIDEVYSNIFVPLIQSRSNQCSHYFDPFGSTAFEDLCQTPYLSDPDKNFLFWDQEPLHIDVHTATLDKFFKVFKSKETIIVTSELNSEAVEWACSKYNAKSSYYFFHGWACLDWYRGYNRTFTRLPWSQRTITDTIFMPNRILGGKRNHRLILLSELARRDCIKNNTVSFPDICPHENQDVKTLATSMGLTTEWVDDLDLPITLPGEEDAGFPNSSFYLDMSHGINSLLYLVTETLFYGRRSHLTEKTFKPICLGMPFILAAPKGSLEYLRSYGFKTFSDVWDESYDLVNDEHRLSAIADLIKHISKLDKQELQQKLAPIVEHNLSWFYEGGFENILWNELKDMVASW